MTRVLEMLPSGLMVPQEKPAEPAREYGPLEFKGDARREVTELLRQLWSITRANHMQNPDLRARRKSQRALVEAMVCQFIGDAEFEEPC